MSGIVLAMKKADFVTVEGHMERQEFVTVEGELMCLESTLFQLEDTGCIYLALDPHRKPEEGHMIYKLHALRDRKTDKLRFYWLGLWNSCCRIDRFGKEAKGFTTIEEAIIWAETFAANGDGGNKKVIRVHFSDLCPDFVVDNLYRIAKIKPC